MKQSQAISPASDLTISNGGIAEIGCQRTLKRDPVIFTQKAIP